MKNACTLAVALAIAVGNLGCFSLQHQLPPNAYFGKLPKGAKAEGVPFEGKAFKNWGLAGLVPYTRWGSPDLLSAQPAVRDAKEIQIREIETVFSPFDVAISIVPGMFYGYYVWATRTIRISGEAQAASPK